LDNVLLKLNDIIVGTFQQSPLPRTNSLLHESLSNAVVRKDVAFIDNGKYGGWFGVLMASIYVTAFGFVGVEAVAATSREAGPKTTERKNHDNPSSQDDNNYEMGRNGTRLDRLRFSSSPNDEANTAEQAEHTTQASRGPANPLQRDQRRQTPGAGDVFRLPAILVPIVAAFIYIWASWSVTQNIDFRDSSLPSLEWAQPNGTSIFIAATDKDNNPGLSKALTALLIVQLFSTSSTALYIASRTLYGIAYIVLRKRGPTGPWPVQIAWRLTRTTKQGVPWVSVLISAWLFWLPFTRYASGSSANIVSHPITTTPSLLM
jgi:amino acid transporter